MVKSAIHRWQTLTSSGAVRERELWQAMDAVGLDDLRILEYRDSGMAGTPENYDPRTLNMATEDALVASLVGHIRELRPSTVITFGPDGGYGHPDHIRIGAATDTAVDIAATPRWPALGASWRPDALYHVASPREAFIEAQKHPDSPFRTMPREMVERFGIPAADITHWVDTSSQVDGKSAAIRRHATQISADHPLLQPASEFAQVWLSREQFRLVHHVGNKADPLAILVSRYPAAPFEAVANADELPE